MKRLCAFLVALALAFALVACARDGGTTSQQQSSEPAGQTSRPEQTSLPETPQVQPPAPPEESSAPQEQDDGQAGEEGGSPYAIAYPADEQEGMEWAPLDAANITQTQRDILLRLVNNVLAGYAGGSLPLAVVENSEYYLNEAVPQGVVLPASVTWDDIELRNYDDFWQVVALVPAEGGQLAVWMSNVSMEDAGHLIVVDQATFDFEA